MKICNKYFLILFFIISILTLFWFLPLFSNISPYQAIRGRIILLHDTNHHELLEAGRYLINKAKVKEVTTLADGQKESVLVIPKNIKIPKTIHRLLWRLKLMGIRNGIDIQNNRKLVIHAGDRTKGFFGVYIYPIDSNNPDNNFDGNKELLPSLWYYDDLYNEDGNQYDKEVETMIKTGKW